MHKTFTPIFVQIIFTQDGHIMHGRRILTIKVNEQSTMVDHECVVHTIHLFAPIKPSYVGAIVQGLWISMNPIQLWNSGICIPSVACSSIESHLISWPKVSLMSDHHKLHSCSNSTWILNDTLKKYKWNSNNKNEKINKTHLKKN